MHEAHKGFRTRSSLHGRGRPRRFHARPSRFRKPNRSEAADDDTDASPNEASRVKHTITSYNRTHELPRRQLASPWLTPRRKRWAW